MGSNAGNSGEQCARALLILCFPGRCSWVAWSGPLVRPHGGSIELQSRDFPHCCVSLKELLIQTDRLTVPVEKLHPVELWTRLPAPLGFRLESTEWKLRALACVLPLPALYRGLRCWAVFLGLSFLVPENIENQIISEFPALKVSSSVDPVTT